ncbi:unnamed protein product [Discosporangium mesarthrocarpum]
MPTSRGQTSIRTRATAVTSMVYDVVKYTPNRWAGEEVEAGFGGVWPGDPNAKTHRVDHDRQVTVVDKAGEEVAAMDVPVDRYIYFAFEEADIDVQIHNQKRMCRNGCCTVCATKVKEGKVKMEGALGLLKELKRDGYALTCCSYPRSDLTLQLQDEDEVYIRQWGETFEGGGVEWGGFLPEDD